jgi:hypothetical protein
MWRTTKEIYTAVHERLYRRRRGLDLEADDEVAVLLDDLDERLDLDLVEPRASTPSRVPSFI